VTYVNIYLVDQAYGGPEEGGWWYDTFAAVSSWKVRNGRRRSRRLRRMLSAARRQCKAMNEGRRPVSSVLSEGEHRAYMEPRPAEDAPRVKPHYE